MIYSILIITLFILVIWYTAQTKLRNKMLCTFRRPNNTKIEKWVQMDNQHVLFKVDRKHVGRYIIDPKCITMQWYDRGLNKLFPVLVPTLDFRWDTPFALDPRNFEVTWMTPSALNAGWEEHNHIAFAKANSLVSGMKKNFVTDVLLPVLTVGLLLVACYLIWTGNESTSANMNTMQGQINQIKGGQSAPIIPSQTAPIVPGR